MNSLNYYYIIPSASFLLLLGLRKYVQRKWSYFVGERNLKGTIVVITGANSGIGYEVAKDLASRDATIVLACKNFECAKSTARSIHRITNSEATLVPMELDLSSFMSIKNFSLNFNERFQRLDILINNAGVSIPRNQAKVTKDGIEINFGINHLGHFYLTNLLLNKLKASRAARIVILSSTLHEKGMINLDDLSCKTFEKDTLYANSKLANVYFGQELANRLEGSPVSVYMVCPGWVYTNLFRYSLKWYHYFLIGPVAFFFMRSPKQGSQTVLYCALAEGLENQSGYLYRDCKLYRSNLQFDHDVCKKLWEFSENFIESKMKLISM